MVEIDVPTLLAAVFALAGAFGIPLAVYWGRAKEKLGRVREFIDELDRDLQDDHLTQSEYAELVKKFKGIFA